MKYRQVHWKEMTVEKLFRLVDQTLSIASCQVKDVKDICLSNTLYLARKPRARDDIRCTQDTHE